MLLEREDIRPATSNNKGHTPLSLAFSQGHDGIAKIILEWGNANSDTFDSGGQAPLLLSAGNGDECVVEMQFPGNDSSAHTPDPHDLPAPSLANSNGRDVALDSKDSVSMSADGNLLTKLSRWSKPPFLGPLKSEYPSKRRRLNGENGDSDHDERGK